jgi:hypothetical protein
VWYSIISQYNANSHFLHYCILLLDNRCCLDRCAESGIVLNCVISAQPESEPESYGALEIGFWLWSICSPIQIFLNTMQWTEFKLFTFLRLLHKHLKIFNQQFSFCTIALKNHRKFSQTFRFNLVYTYHFWSRIRYGIKSDDYFSKSSEISKKSISSRHLLCIIPLEPKRT